jgi:hypothetical protein
MSEQSTVARIDGYNSDDNNTRVEMNRPITIETGTTTFLALVLGFTRSFPVIYFAF